MQNCEKVVLEEGTQLFFLSLLLIHVLNELDMDWYQTQWLTTNNAIDQP